MVATFMGNYPHSQPAHWFDEEIRDVLGLDLLAEPFDPEVGYATYAIGASSVLVLQVELPDERKETVLRDFLQAPSLRLERSNVGSEKRYANVYQRFRAGIEFDTEFWTRSTDRATPGTFTRRTSWRASGRAGGCAGPAAGVP